MRRFCLQLKDAESDLKKIETEFQLDRSQAVDTTIWMHLGSLIREMFCNDDYQKFRTLQVEEQIITQIEDPAKVLRSKFNWSTPSMLCGMLRIVDETACEDGNTVAADAFLLLCMR